MPEQEMLSIIVDGNTYQVPSGDNLLATLLKLKKRLPYFCWHPVMGSVGACRQCAVTQYQDQNDKRGRLVMACTTPVTDGMRITLEDENSSDFREQVIAAMMTNHPHDCPVCAEGGECHLQDMTVMTGHSARHFKGLKRTFENQHLGEFIGHEMNRCITCYRCDRFYKDVAGGKDFSVQGSKNQVYFGRHQDGQLESEFSGNLVEVCPTGVFTNKPFSAHFARKWDLQSSPSVCNHCSVGCNTSIGERYGVARRVTNRFNEQINGYFICDRGRFGIAHVNTECRIREVKGISAQSPLSLSSLDIAKTLSHYRTKKWCAIGSARASLEANYLLAEMVGTDNFCSGFSENEMLNAYHHLALLEQHEVCSIAEMEDVDCVLVVNQDLTLTAPRAALAIRQAINKAGIDKAASIGIQYWQENAVKTAKGEELLPCFHLTSSRNKLMDVDKQSVLTNDTEILNLLKQMTCKITATTDGQLEEAETAFIEQVITCLRKAKNPLLVTGWQTESPEIMQAFRELVDAVKLHVNSQLNIAVFPPAANSVGIMSLMQENPMSLQTMLSNDSYQGLIVLENELSHLSTQEAQTLLSRFEQVIVIDHTFNQVSKYSHVVLPSATIAESQGHFVNYQAVVQPFWATYPVKQPIRASWQWLLAVGDVLFPEPSRATISDVDALQTYLASVFKQWPEIKTDVNQNIARETHRASGRTSKYANQTVHEPKTTHSGSAYRYSMEGSTLAKNETAHQPYVWTPGWNSNQSIFQHSGTQAQSVKLKVKGLTSMPSYDRCAQGEESKPVYLNRGWYLHEWQSSQVAEFKLAQSPDRLYISSEYAQEHGLIDKCYGLLTLAQTQKVIVEVCIDQALRGEHIYGQVQAHKVNCDITLVPATFEEVEHYKQQQSSQKTALEKEKQRVLKQLKSNDQYVPIRFINQESSHD